MGPKKRPSASLGQIFRSFLRNVALSMIAAKYKNLGMGDAKKALLNKLDLSPSALEAMLYRGSGGMDSWVELFGALTDMNPEQFDLALTEMREILKKKRKLSKGEAAWIKRGDSLSDDKKLFWDSLIGLMEELEGGPYTIQSRKKDYDPHSSSDT